ncbi:MAG: hypothetical protein WDN27_00215 [Candidatus Saccharibacteria bacterium]
MSRLTPDQITSEALANAKHAVDSLVAVDAPLAGSTELLVRLRGVSEAVSAIALSKGGIEIVKGSDHNWVYPAFVRRTEPDEYGITDEFRVLPGDGDTEESKGAMMTRQYVRVHDSTHTSLHTRHWAFLPTDTELTELEATPPVLWDKRHISAVNKDIRPNSLIFPFNALRDTPDAADNYFQTVRLLCQELIEYTA